MAEFHMYFPTPSETKLLNALLDPENVLLGKKEICEKAGVTRAQFNKAFKNQKFVDYYKSLVGKVLSQAAAPVSLALINEAKKGNFNHIKLLLEMTGMYTPKTAHEVSGKNGGPVEFSQLSTEQLKQKVKEIVGASPAEEKASE